MDKTHAYRSHSNKLLTTFIGAVVCFFIITRFWPGPHDTVTTLTAPKTFCYYTYNGSDDDLEPEMIDGSLCDYLLLGFADIDNNRIVGQGSRSDAIWRRVVKLKESFRHLSVLLSVGASAKKFSASTFNDSSLKQLVESAVAVIETYNFDGLDVDWEFPAWNGMPADDQQNFIWLLRELRQAFNTLNTFGTGKNILLTTAVAAPFSIVEISYLVPEMVAHIDYCLLMGYDFNRFNPLWPVAEFNSPLYRHRGQILLLALLNIAAASDIWVDKGMPKEKLVIGLPFYGVSFELCDKNLFQVGSPVVGTGLYNGTVTYQQMCKLLESDQWTAVFHNESRVPYAYRTKDWITYENPRSIEEKAQWILDNDYAGVMTFNLNYDDFNGTCNNSKVRFPLQTIISEAVKQKRLQLVKNL